MSTTSTNSGRHKTGRRRKRKDDLTNNWSNNKLKEELSSFIAEFSYLTATDPNNTDRNNVRNKLKPQLTNNAQQTYVTDTGSSNAQGFLSSNKSFEDRKIKKKTVEWKDRKDTFEVPKTYPKNRKDQSPNETISQENTRKERGLSAERSTARDHRVRNKSRNRSRSRTRENRPSRSRLSSRSRERSGLRKTKRQRSISIYQEPYRRRKHKTRDSQSGLRWYHILSRKYGRKKSDHSIDYVKSMPYYYQRKKKNYNNNLIAPSKSQSIPIPIIRKTEVRDSQSEATVVTLYPKKRPNLQIQCSSKNLLAEHKFLEESALPCKCQICKKKYEQLVNATIPSETKLIQSPKPNHRNTPECPRICFPPLVCAPLPYFCEQYCCNMPYYTEPYKPPHTKPYKPRCEDESVYDKRCCRSNTYIKPNCLRQNINPKIAQYFKAILNQFNC